MKKSTRNLLLLGLAGVGAYFYLKKKAQPGLDLLGGAGELFGGLSGAANDLANQVASLPQTIGQQVGYAQNQVAQAYGGAVGGAYGAVFPQGPVGQSTPQATQAFSSLFNTFVGGGTQLTQPNTAGTAVNLNPNLVGAAGPVFSGPAQIVQGALTSAAINAGVGVASLTPQAGGGVATNFAALAPKTAAAPTVAMSQNPIFAKSTPAQAGVSMSSAQIASRLARGF